MARGRVVFQDYVRINNAIKTGELEANERLKEAFEYCKKNNKKLHIMGLVSDGGIHSHSKHGIAISEYAHKYGLSEVFFHAFTDGRDTDPKSGIHFLEELEKEISRYGAKVASVSGRYYAMDRDLRWERTKKTYDVLTEGKGEKAKNVVEKMKDSYNNGITDEFIVPFSVQNDDNTPVATISEGDAIVCFNFRTDRCRQITRVLTQEDLPNFEMKTVPLHYVTMAKYDENFKGVSVLFDKENLTKTLGEILEREGKTQLRMAETEKYPHVTFFFSGGNENESKGEKRMVVSSPKVATYDLKPEMSAFELKDVAVKEISKNTHDFICLNFANPDMVGHTGDYSAIIKAVETTDTCLGEVVNAGLKNGYEMLIIADHGNADFAINPDGSPNTAHTTNLVPAILVSHKYTTISDGILADIAPTILKLMDIQTPPEMTGTPLV